MQKDKSVWLTVCRLDKGLDQQGESPPENGLGGDAPTHWLSFEPDIAFEGIETVGVSEEKGD